MFETYDTTTIDNLRRRGAYLSLLLKDTVVAAGYSYLGGKEKWLKRREIAKNAAKMKVIQDELEQVNAAIYTAENHNKEIEVVNDFLATEAAWKKTKALTKIRHDLAVKAETEILNLHYPDDLVIQRQHTPILL